MTGEITLRGRVLGIGGLREKSVAAHRGRIKHVVIPKANAREVEELPADVREGLTFHPVATMDEVLALAFRARPRPTETVAEIASQPAPSLPIENGALMAATGADPLIVKHAGVPWWDGERRRMAARVDAARGGVCRPVERREVVAAERAAPATRGGARIEDARAHARDQLLPRSTTAFVLVDLPGYGYARVAKERQAEWQPLIEGYLQSSPNLRGLVLLLDARRDPSDDDHDDAIVPGGAWDAGAGRDHQDGQVREGCRTRLA